MPVIHQVVFNQIIVGGLFTHVSYYLLKWRSYPNITHLPSLPRFAFDIVLFILIEEIGFYYSHRLLHHPKIYKFIHKRHHEWTAPIAITAIYCHPVEHVFANLIPITLGMLSNFSSSNFILYAKYFRAGTGELAFANDLDMVYHGNIKYLKRS